jgi:hypothetical protein
MSTTMRVPSGDFSTVPLILGKKELRYAMMGDMEKVAPVMVPSYGFSANPGNQRIVLRGSMAAAKRCITLAVSSFVKKVTW